MIKYRNEEKFTRLADSLERDDAFKYAKVINRLRAGYYHDFASPHPTPKVVMDADLRDVGLKMVADKVRNGDYDQ